MARDPGLHTAISVARPCNHRNIVALLARAALCALTAFSTTTAGHPAHAEPVTSIADVLPPLPLPHPNRASASRKASTARAAELLALEQARRNVRSSTESSDRPAAPPAVSRTVAEAAARQPAQSASSRPDTSATSPSRGNIAHTPSQAATTSQSASDQPSTWSQAVIDAAAQECDELLGSIGAEAASAELLAPIRQGQCGTAAPLKVSRIGGKDGTILTPPAVMNCRMLARLHRWLETVAQPAARDLLGSRIVKLTNASAYVCRNRYNDAAAKISEHAFANALDVSSFVLADGRRIDVQSYWGNAVTAAAAAATAREPANAAVPQTAATRPTPPIAPRAMTAGLKVDTERKPVAKDTTGNRSELDRSTLPSVAAHAFLRNIHDAACGIFTTVLGPEANAAHRDHFHLDLQKRRSKAYCQ